MKFFDDIISRSKLASELLETARLLKTVAISVKELYTMHETLKKDVSMLAQVVNTLVQIEQQKNAAAKSTVEWTMMSSTSKMIH